MGRRIGLGLLVALALPSAALAGNEDEVLLGNQAALTGGAVTATGSDGGSLWYNPAGIAGVDQNKVDVSASAFTLRTVALTDAILASTGESADLHFAQFITVPSTLSYVRPIGDRFRLGLGIFVRRQSDFTARQTLEVTEVGAPGTPSEWIALLAARSSSYVASAGFAWEPTPSFRLGMALYFLYDSVSGTSQLAGGIRMPGGLSSTIFLSASELFSRQQLGLRMGFGMQWEPAPGFHLGATVHTPSYAFFMTSRRAVLLTGFAQAPDGAATGFYAPEDLTGSETGFEPFEPFMFRVGASYVGERFRIAVDGDIRSGLRNDALAVRRGVVLNARVGGVVRLGDRFELGAGVFTDLNPNERLGFAESGVDFVGLAAGIEYSNGYQVTSADDEEDEGGRLVFSTSLAVRYAHGRGQTGGLFITPATGEPPPPGSNADAIQLAPSRVNELTVHIGSGFRF